MIWPDLDWSEAIRRFLAHFGLGVILSVALYSLLEKFFVSPDNREGFRRATWVGFFGGIFSVAIDLDHIVMWFGAAYTRPLHWPVFGLALIAAVFLFFMNESGRRPPLYWFIWCVCLMVHVVEDFTLNWF